jgi:RND superfamily putative drug exporter
VSEPGPQSVAPAPARALAWVTVRLRFLVVPVFVAAAVWCGLHLRPFEAGGPVLNLVPDHSAALQATADSTRLFGAPAGSDVIAVQRDPSGLSQAAQRRVVERARRVAAGHDPSGAQAAIPLIDVPGFRASRGDRTTAVTHLIFDGSASSTERTAGGQRYMDEMSSVDAPVGITGVTPARIEQGTLILDRLDLIELLTVAVVALIVVAVFRSPGAAVVTLSALGVAFPITLWALGELSARRHTSLPQEVEPMVVALLLGVVTDYTVFFLSDARDRIRVDDDVLEGVRAATAEVAPIVFTGGLILSVSLLALLASSLGFFRDLGPILAATVAAAMLVSLVFIPSLIALLGRMAVWPSVRPGEDAGQKSGFGRRLAHLAAGRPLAAVIGVVGVVLLVGCGLQLRSMELGVDVISGLPAGGESRAAATAADTGFAPGVLAPLEVIVRRSSQPLDPVALAALQQRLGAQPGFAGVIGPAQQPAAASRRPFLTQDGHAARVVLVSQHDPLGPTAVSDLDRLQSRMPDLLQASHVDGATAEYAGQTALAQAAVDGVTRDAVTIGAAVLAVNLLLMMLFMRALVAPLALLAVNVLSVFATLGLVTWIFQDLLGYPDTSYYVPFAAGVLLVSLSSDYNVLIAGRIWQEAERRPMREAITEAAPRASRAIRAAGLSLAASFALVALIPVRSFRELAAAMAIGVLLETFLVRSLLAPAVIALLGRLAAWPGRPGWTSRRLDEPASEA